MRPSMLSTINQFKYNHEVWIKYSYSHLGYDIFLAEFQSSKPGLPLKIRFGKWFVSIRLFRWQVVLNKLNIEQRKRLRQLRELEEDMTNSVFQRHNNSLGF
jgi:hypothetical protein